MKKPSPEYISKLILCIQEAKAETGKSFNEFIDNYKITLEKDGGLKITFADDYELIQALKGAV